MRFEAERVTMSCQPDVTAILTGHREGLLAGPASRSLLTAVETAEASGIRCQIVAVLDRVDTLTREVLRTGLGDRATFIESDEGDPGKARSIGISAATGGYACFLDADDLWSTNWITGAFAAVQERPDAIFHSACNMIFGDDRLMFWHVDSESPDFDPLYLEFNNYWDALCFAKTEIFRATPFRANDLTLGFGHEDWHWNAMTLAKGIPHKPVPGTMHFKRARSRSQMSKVNEVGSVRWPLDESRMRSAVEAA